MRACKLQYYKNKEASLITFPWKNVFLVLAIRKLKTSHHVVKGL